MRARPNGESMRQLCSVFNQIRVSPYVLGTSSPGFL